jgi:hypothetical protein
MRCPRIELDWEINVKFFSGTKLDHREAKHFKTSNYP